MVKPDGAWTPQTEDVRRKEELPEFALTAMGCVPAVKLALDLLRLEPPVGLLFRRVIGRCTGFMQDC